LQLKADLATAEAKALLDADNAANGLFDMIAPKNAGSVSVAGIEYLVVDGVVTVPAEAMPELLAFGYAIPGEAD
jgi:hypothetical protein